MERLAELRRHLQWQLEKGMITQAESDKIWEKALKDKYYTEGGEDE